MKLFGRFDLTKIFKSPPQGGVELGESGTSIFGGYITDEDYVTELTGSQAIETYDKMRKSDGVVKAAILACELPIRAANWYIEPASEEDKDKEVADFVSACLFEKMTITWDDFLRQALMMLPFGFMVFEKVFAGVEVDGKDMIGWRKFAPRLPATILKWKTETGEDGVTQQLTTGGNTSIPIEKLLIFTHNKEGDNWLGISVLRSAYRPWFFKSHIEKINAIAFERQGLGIPRVKLPMNATIKDITRAKTLVKNIRANEQSYLLQPYGWDIEFMDPKAKGVKDPSETVRRLNREILISVLAQFLDLGSGPTGSRALSADHSSTFHNNLTAIARQVKDAINKYAIKQLVDLNYTVAEYPTLEFSRIGLPRYVDLAKALQGLTQVGVITPDEKLEENVRQIMDLPEKPEEEEEKPEPKEVPKQKELKPEPEKREASEFVSWRDLTFAEKKLGLKDIERKMDSTEDRLRIDLKEILSRTANDLIRQMQIVLETTSSTEKRQRIKNMSVRYKSEYRKAIFNAVKDMFQYGKTVSAHEMRKDVPPTPAKDLQGMSKQADTLTTIMEDDMMKAGKLALLTGLQHMSEKTFSITSTLAMITKAVRGEAKRTAFNVSAIVVNGAINQGRRTTFTTYGNDIYALQRSEILDSVTCNFCMSIDSRVFRKKDSFTQIDGVHSSCRGIWVEILKVEAEKPKIAGIPKVLRENFVTVNQFRPPKHPIVKKESPAADFLREEKRLEESERIELDREKERIVETVKPIIKLNETIKETLENEEPTRDSKAD